MIKIFLSHSSHDKEAIKRLAQDLLKHNFNVWLDEWEICVGESIPDRVQKGLQDATFVAVWLTKQSILSGWLTKEWHTCIFREIASRRVLVLPLLAEDCEIPLFLSDKRYADFRQSYKIGLRALIRSLKSFEKKAPLPEEPADHSITQLTTRFLHDLEGTHIPFPCVGTLQIIKSLKSLPRSGKYLRLEGVTPTIPIRSIYDHILSVAHSADSLLDEIDHSVSGHGRIELARLIAYHDICEVILGDIPQYTKLNKKKRSRARIEAEIRLSQLPQGEPERITNQFIAMFLQESERQSFLAACEILKGNSSIRRLFYGLDKLDPIIAVWRYIHYLRNDKKFNIDVFLERLRHFFENPQVHAAVTKNIDDVRMSDLVHQLQNPKKAKHYYEQSSLLSDDIFAIPEPSLRCLIEGRPLEFSIGNSDRKRQLNKPANQSQA